MYGSAERVEGAPVTAPSAVRKFWSWAIRASVGAGGALKSALKHRSWAVRAGKGAGGWLKNALKSAFSRAFNHAFSHAFNRALKDRSWKARAGIGASAAIVILGIAAACLALLGRPAVSVSSGEALVHVQLGGVGTKVTAIRATSDDRALALARRGTDFVPVAAVPQGRTVHVRVTAAPPSWLRWLLGSGVSTTATLRAPSAAPSADVAVAARPGRVALVFDRPVSVIDYQAAGQPARVIRFGRPTATAQLAVPDDQSGGALQVTAAAWPWERLAAQTTTVDWLEGPRDGVPVVAADPAPGSTNASLDGPITLTFDEPVAKALGTRRPRISPATAGTWTEPDADTLVFTPRRLGFGPGAAVSVAFDRRVTVVNGSSARSVAVASASGSYHFDVAQISVLRLQQILAQLHYLPLDFTPAPGVRLPTTVAGEAATLGSPLKGSFSWRWPSAPAALQAQWQPGSPTTLVQGALMSFMSDTQSSFNGYTADDESVSQLADGIWQGLVSAAAANQVDPNPFSYVHVSENLPETLDLWENGRTVLTTPVNTGIPGRATALGTYPIYVRYTVNQMTGTNPDGSHYDDTVYWINYFNGGDAVHGFPRGSYGWPQSLGCVELPVPTAEVAFNHLAIGDLVTVAP
jgi:L,D-transpeptidase catalytic domain/Bacterial Ig-like domain